MKLLWNTITLLFCYNNLNVSQLLQQVQLPVPALTKLAERLPSGSMVVGYLPWRTPAHSILWRKQGNYKVQSLAMINWLSMWNHIGDCPCKTAKAYGYIKFATRTVFGILTAEGALHPLPINLIDQRNWPTLTIHMAFLIASKMLKCITGLTLGWSAMETC